MDIRSLDPDRLNGSAAPAVIGLHRAVCAARELQAAADRAWTRAELMVSVAAEAYTQELDQLDREITAVRIDAARETMTNGGAPAEQALELKGRCDALVSRQRQLFEQRRELR